MSGGDEVHAVAATSHTRANRPTLSCPDLGVSTMTEPQVSAPMVRAPAPADAPQDPHRHVFELQFYVLAGRMTISQGGTMDGLGPGDVVVQLGGDVHWMLRHSADPALVEVAAPAGDGAEVGA